MGLLANGRRVITGCAVFGALWLVPVGTAWAVPPNTPDSGTWGTNGRVWSIVRLGDTVYIAGTFTQAIAPNGALTPRSNLMAINASTGALVTGFAPNPNGTVYALATDGSRLFAGGEFTSVAGHARSRFAAFDSSGALVAGWKPKPNSAKGVWALRVTADRIYVGGDFTQMNGLTYRRYAQFSITP